MPNVSESGLYRPVHGGYQSPSPVAEREPYGYWVKHKLSDGVLLRKPSYIPEAGPKMEVVPLYLDPPPTSELEAEIARLRAERDDFKDEWQAELEKRMEVQVRLRATEARLAEAKKALEQIAAIEPVSNCDAGSTARSRMRDIARYSIARRPK